MNLSLKSLPDEPRQPVPHFENRFMISDKGRVRRLSGWTIKGRKVFLHDQILSQSVLPKVVHHSLFSVLNHEGRQKAITTAKLMYYCFMENFDLFGKTQIVVNKSEPFWNIDITKLSLYSIYSVLKGKIP